MAIQKDILVPSDDSRIAEVQARLGRGLVSKNVTIASLDDLSLPSAQRNPLANLDSLKDSIYSNLEYILSAV